MATALRIVGYFRKYWLATSIAYICLLVMTGIELTIPALIKQVIDCGMRVGGVSTADCPTGVDPLSLVLGASLLIVSLTVVKGAFHFAQGYLGEYGAQGIAYDIRNEIYRHLQRLSFSWHDRAQTGAAHGPSDERRRAAAELYRPRVPPSGPDHVHGNGYRHHPVHHQLEAGSGLIPDCFLS